MTDLPNNSTSAGTNHISSKSTSPPPLSVSRRSTQIPPFYVMEVVRLTSQLESSSSSTTGEHPRMLHLEVGQPSTNPPQPIIDTIARSLTQPLSYTPALGRASLREALSKYYSRYHDTEIAASGIAVTMGASGALQAVLACCFDPGARIGVATPGYPCHRNVILALGMIPVALRRLQSEGIIEDEGMELGLDGVIVASPANPTGAVLEVGALRKLVQMCVEKRWRLVFDETYVGVSEMKIMSALRVEEELGQAGIVVTVGSFSKYWCMTGLRVGWIGVRDSELIRALERYIQNVAICAPVLGQKAAETALVEEEACKEELDAHVQRYRRNMKLLASMIQDVGFDVDVPPGAFYLYAGCEKVCKRIGCDGAKELVNRLLMEIRVAITPAVDFDQELGNKFVRFSCAGQEEDIKQAGLRIIEYVNKF